MATIVYKVVFYIIFEVKVGVCICFNSQGSVRLHPLYTSLAVLSLRVKINYTVQYLFDF